jgi:hypothetical protein
MNRLRNANQGLITGSDTGCPIVTFPYANLNTVSTVDTFTTSGCALTGQHGFLELATNDGNSNYNGLELSLRRRMSKGVGFAVNYTWSHGLANYGDNLTAAPLPQNAYDYAAEMSNSVLDIRQRFVSNFTWDLPFGRGKRFLSSGAVGKVLGDWQFNGIVTLQTGQPFSVNSPDESFTGSSHSSYADCIGNPYQGTPSNPPAGPYLNLSAFAAPSPGTFGTCRPLGFYGPGLRDADLSLFKGIPISERVRMQFRAEFFNAFNHPNFANPGFPYVLPGVGALPGTFQITNTISPILGTSSGGPGDPREIQFALKLFF